MSLLPSAPISWKDRARVASAGANVTLSAPGATLDGVTLATNDRVLLKDQSTGSQNGLWLFNGAAVAMTRPLDFVTGSTLSVQGSHQVSIAEGTLNADTAWLCTTNGAITVDTTALAYQRIDGSWSMWKTLYHSSALLASAAAAGTWVLRYDGGTPIVSSAAQNGGAATFMLDPAQYAVTGKTIQVRLAAYVLTNSTAPGITFTFGLYPITASAAFVFTLGTATPTVAIATPALNTRTAGWSSAITMPAAGAFALACLTSGTAASATQIIGAAVQVRGV